MIYAETERLILRRLEKAELPRLVQLLDVWDIARWLTVVPFPYTMQDAENFYNEMQPHYDSGIPEFYVLAQKSDNLLIGGLGLNPPRAPHAMEGAVEIGYWLGKDYWGQGLMKEGAAAAVKIGFARPTTTALCATSAPGNQASNKVLAHIGLRDCGIFPRTYKALRGSEEVVRWLLTREQYEKGLRV